MKGAKQFLMIDDIRVVYKLGFKKIIVNQTENYKWNEEFQP